jgi:hypothetical protein
VEKRREWLAYTFQRNTDARYSGIPTGLLYVINSKPIRWYAEAAARKL